MSIRKGKASASIRTFPSTSTVRQGFLPIGIMNPACRGSLRSITTVRNCPYAPGAYLRFHRNQWAAAEEIFITPEMWDPNVDHSHHSTAITREPLFVGIDVGIKHDNAARVAVRWDEAGEKLTLVSHRMWKPTPSEPLDLENTVEQDLRDLNIRCRLVLLRNNCRRQCW